MDAAAVTVITPTLNAARYLEECLDSVAAQLDGHVEHLVVDGGSTDATRDIVRASHATLIQTPGLGQAAAVNAGIRQASNAIVGWLNADDLYAPDALQHVVAQFQSEPRLDVVYGDCLVIDAAGKPLWRIAPGAYDFQRLLRRGNYFAQPSVLFRRRVFEQVGYLDEALDFGMDYELWLRLPPVAKRYIPQLLASFRWHAESKTSRNLKANWDELLCIVRRHGGGWTPSLRWSYARARLTAARLELRDRLAYRR